MDGHAHHENPLLIKGNFKPTRGIRIFRVILLVLGGGLSLGVLGILVMYGLIVHYESAINTTGKETRLLNEGNKDLQVKVNRLQSYQSIEAASVHVSFLKKPSEIIEVDARYVEKRLPGLPKREKAWPKVYGY